MSGCVLMLNMRAHSAKRRLVHRLDRETSGALVVARTAAAAAWLSAAFSRRAAAAGSSGGGGISGVDGGRRRQPLRHAGPASQPSVQRVYWAVVECGSGSAVQPVGIIEEPLEVPPWLPGNLKSDALLMHHVLRRLTAVGRMCNAAFSAVRVCASAGVSTHTMSPMPLPAGSSC